MGAKFADRLLRPSFEGDVENTDMARLLNAFLLMSLAAVVLYLAVSGLFGDPPQAGVLIALGMFGVVVMVSLWFLRRGYVQHIGVVITLTIWSFCTFLVFRYGGIHDEVVPGYFVAIAVAGLILGDRGLLVFSILSGVALTTAFYLEIAGITTPSNSFPSEVRDLVVILVLLGLLGFFVRYAIHQLRAMASIARSNAEAVLAANAALEKSHTDLLVERDRLTRRLHASIAVTQVATASVGDLGQLLDHVTEAIAREFGFYHVAVFWVNPVGGDAVIRAASSVEGRLMLARGHRRRIGEGIVGSVVLDGHPRLVSDVTVDTDFAHNPDLPDTRSELAVPILAQDQVLGVLDIQSSETAAFTEEDTAVLQSLVRQLSLAISNTRFLEGIQRDLDSAERAYRDITQEDWRRLLQSEGGIGFLSTQHGTALVDTVQMEMAVAQTAGPARGGGNTVRFPVELAGQIVAEVEAHLPAGQANWTQEQVALLETLSAQLSQALDRARLHRETQRRATRERVLREISDDMGRASDLPSLLRLTVESLNRSLGGSHLYVKLAAEPSAYEDAGPVPDMRG